MNGRTQRLVEGGGRHVDERAVRDGRTRTARPAWSGVRPPGVWLLIASAVALACGGCDRAEPPPGAPQVVQEAPSLPSLALGAAAGAEEVVPPAPPAAPDPLPPAPPEGHPIKVRSGETLGLYERWSGVSEDELKEQNGLRKARGLRVGQTFTIVMTPEQAVQFSRMRREFHRRREEAFFRTHAIVQLMPYVVRPGDTLRGVSTRYSDVPRWLMEKVNRGHDMTHLRPGDIINLPVVREAPPATARELEARAAALAAAAGADDEGDGFTLPAPDGPLAVPSTPLADPALAPPAARAPASAWDDEGGADEAGAPGSPPSPAAPPGHGAETWFSDSEGDGPPPPPVVDVDVKVRKGERVVHYAQWAGTTVDRIAKANDLLDPGRLRIGQQLKIPVEESRVADFYEQRRVFHNGPDPTPPPAAIRGNARPGEASAAGAAAAAASGAADATFAYTVRPGETAWEIAVKRFGLTLRDLERLNPTIDLNRLRVGDELRIPVSVIR